LLGIVAMTEKKRSLFKNNWKQIFT